jgi:hypothetical protein
MINALRLLVLVGLLQIGGCNPGALLALLPLSPVNRSEGVPVKSEILFDFSQPGTAQAWFPANDDVMGGVSQSQITTTDAGTALFTGVISFENNGGFATTQVNFNPPVDLSRYTGIEVRVRGDGKRYGMYLDDHPNVINFEAQFQTDVDTWQEIRLPFTDFKPLYFGQRVSAQPLDPSRIRSMSFIIEYKQEGAFALEIARIALYR